MKKPSISFLTASSDSVLVTKTMTVITSLTDNPTYSKIDPTLAVITASRNDFVDAIAAAADGGKQLTWAKKVKRTTLVDLMRLLATASSSTPRTT
ncbi:MAG: hypothetical protein ACR2F0_00925 [Chthoniobacterales bacterium]